MRSAEKIENEEAVEDLFGITAPITDYSRQVGAALDIA